MRVQIAVDEKALSEIERRLGDLQKKAPNVLTRALNRAATTAQKNIKKETTKRYRIKSTQIVEKGRLKLNKASFNSLGASITAKGSPIGLDHFKVSPLEPRHSKPPKSIKAAVKKGPMEKIPSAFVANSGNGNFVWSRRSDSKHQKKHVNGRTVWSQLKIDRLYGPSVPQMIGNEETIAIVQSEAEDMYQRTLDHEVNRLLGG